MFDLHVHASPDVVARLGDDTTLADYYARAGASGFVLKGHYEATTGRAAAVSHGRALRVYGGIVCNHHVGGLNPAAVHAALELGARIVWLPTVDAAAHVDVDLARIWTAEPRLATPPLAIPPRVPADSPAAEAVRLICQLVADADAVLATGHLSAAEIAWLLPQAQAAGVQRLLLTHPGYTVPNLSLAAMSDAAAAGAMIEITSVQLLHQPGCQPPDLAAIVDAVGPSSIVLSSDAGQVDSPPPPEALQHLSQALSDEGIPTSALEAMMSSQPEGLVAP